ncbi:hypothetical protein AAE250_11650 [Bacteroides sp. GD17]|jgi:hypothetical protein|uniref:hypothetical protein n=1 Tax=Bacteroides sp. GD17 TaxID=3139826 RepID=UPI00204ED956|nr:hypothetical protein [uncultured Bacteroides sp.]DAV44332.1 MAG TPA: hypothetical protein [Caudoviricetes sp.]
MAKVFYKSVIPNDKPMWLLKLQLSVSQALEFTQLNGDERDFKNLKTFIDAEIRSMIGRREINRSVVETNIVTDNGRTVLNIFRNGNLVQTYFIE